jgi:uncharacterized protein YndB with AHSA1/START domain
MKKSDDLIIVEETYPVSIDTLWRAVTEYDQMIQWYFNNIPDFKAEVGFETQFKVHSEDRTFTHLWKITEVIPRQRITYSWNYEEYKGTSLATFELAEAGDQVKLSLICEVLADFPDEIPEFERESCIAGWRYFLGGNLRAYFGG